VKTQISRSENTKSKIPFFHPDS